MNPSGLREVVKDEAGVSPPRAIADDDGPILIVDAKGRAKEVPKKSAAPLRSKGRHGSRSRSRSRSKNSSSKTSRSKKNSSRKRRSTSKSSVSSLSSLSSGHGHGHGHRSRSRSGSRSKQQRRSKSKKSISPSKDEVSQKVNEELDALVDEFCVEEKKMISWMEGEKRKFLAKRESHRDYTYEWNHFYKGRCKAERTTIHPSMIKDEWEAHWERFVTQEHRVKVEDEGVRLMRRFGLRSVDIREYHIRRKKKEIEALKNQPQSNLATGMIFKNIYKLFSHKKVSNTSTKKISKKLPKNFLDVKIIFSYFQPQNFYISSFCTRFFAVFTNILKTKWPKENIFLICQNDPVGTSGSEEVTVLNTLRILSAIESLLETFGPKVMMALASANGLEAKYGPNGSKELIDQQDFFTLGQNIKAVLLHKLNLGVILTNQMKAVRTCIDNITVLLQQSKCKHLVPAQSGPNPDTYDNPLKKTIAATIIGHFKALGRDISQQELDNLVNSEFNRVQDSQLQQQQQQHDHQHQYQQDQRQYQQDPRQYQQDPRQYQQDPRQYQQDPRQYQQDPRQYQQDPRQYQQNPLQDPRDIEIRQVSPPAAASEKVNPEGTENLNVDWSALRSAVQTVTSVSSTTTTISTPEIAPKIAAKEPVFEVISANAGAGDEDEAYDDLTIEELTSLFKNFKDLDNETQRHLIAYMKKLEKTNPTKVTELKSHIHAEKN
jgi:hypothetical protein